IQPAGAVDQEIWRRQRETTGAGERGGGAASPARNLGGRGWAEARRRGRLAAGDESKRCRARHRLVARQGGRGRGQPATRRQDHRGQRSRPARGLSFVRGGLAADWFVAPRDRAVASTQSAARDGQRGRIGRRSFRAPSTLANGYSLAGSP